MADYVEKEQLEVDVASQVTEMKRQPSVFLDYIRAAGKDYDKFKLKCEGSDLNELVVGKIPNELKGYSALGVVRDEYDLSPIIERLAEELENNSITIETLMPVFRLYKAVSPDRPIKALPDPLIHSLLSQAEIGSEEYFELVAMRLARTSDFSPNSGPAQQALALVEDDILEEIATRIQFYAVYGNLLVSFVSWEKPLLKGVLRKITLGSYGSSKMNISSVLPYFNDLYSKLEISAEDFLGRLNDWAGFAEKSVTSENITEVIPVSDFFEYSIAVENRLTSHCITCMVEYLGGLGAPEWNEALRDEESYEFEVTYWLLKGGQLREPPENAVTVYKELLTESAAGTFTMAQEQKWSVFYDRTNKNKLKPTFKNIRDAFIANVAITPALFKRFSEMLQDHGDLRQRSPDVARKILAPVATDDACLSIIVGNASFYGSLVADAGDDADDLKDVVRQKLAADGSDANLLAFAQEIGLISPLEKTSADQAEEAEPEAQAPQ
jgi:hypothetical protein